MQFNKAVFKEYDIRGIVEKDFSEEFVYNLARAFTFMVAQTTPSKRRLKIAIARDSRLTGPMLFDWFVKGVTSCGADVIDLGLCPTPVLYFSMFAIEPDGSVMITGSHNPSEYNGFKLGIGLNTIYGEKIQKLRALFEQGNQMKGKGTVKTHDILTTYFEYLLERHQILKQLKRRPKVVIDAGNGTAGVTAPKLFKDLGLEVIELFCEPDGNFPNHHPDPTIEKNLTHIKDKVLSTKADIGFAFDGDSDRIGLIDEKGQVLWGDEIMIILARDVLKRNPGATIIGDVKCSSRMYKEIEKAGGKPVMWKTGHSLIKGKMKEEKALLAGEMSGHIFFAENYLGFDDAVHGALEITRILAQKPKSFKMSDLLADLPPIFITPEIRLECEELHKFKLVKLVIEKIKQHHESQCPPLTENINLIDGVRIEFKNGWGLVRASNTQPLIVLRFEATNQEKLDEYKSFVEKVLQQARGEIKN